MEPVVAYLVENRGWSRVHASAWVGVAIWLLGLGTIFSFNLWSGYTLFGGMTFFDVLDFIASNLLLPLGGALIAVVAAWRLSEKSRREELALEGAGYRIWRFLTRYVTPFAVLAVLLNVTGLLGWLLG
jgi:NSS family neurotransmitter:Na+ symporter